MTAFVINSKRNGLPVIRSLGSHGIEVVCGDHFEDAIGLYSRFAKTRCLLPFVTEGEESFVRAVADVAKCHLGRKDIVLIPTSDAHLLAFARYWHILKDNFLPLFETDLDILERCLDKTRILGLADAVGVPVPMTLVSPPVGKRMLGLSFPVIVKPDIRSSAAAIRAGIFRLKVCYRTEDVEYACDELEKLGFNYVVQNYISGEDDTLYTVGTYSVKGNILATFTGRKLRQFPPGQGECAFGEVIDEPRIVDYARRLIEECRLSGISQIEFKRNGDEFYLIEINPRVWSWIGLSAFAGIDLPWIAYQHLISKRCSYPSQTRFKGTWIYLGEDLRADVKRENSVGSMRIFWQAATANSHSIWCYHDPLPGIVQSLREVGLNVPKRRITIQMR